jgi:hypothetical protein
MYLRSKVEYRSRSSGPLEDSHHLVHGIRRQMTKKVVAEVAQMTTNQQVTVSEPSARWSRG